MMCMSIPGASELLRRVLKGSTPTSALPRARLSFIVWDRPERPNSAIHRSLAMLHCGPPMLTLAAGGKRKRRKRKSPTVVTFE